MRSITLRTGTLTHPDNVAYDCTAGSSVRREPHDDGDAIVVGGVTTTQGGWESQSQGRRASGTIRLTGMKGMRMQTADQILQAIQKLGEQRQPLTRIYRCLYNPQLYLAAYNKIYRNQGALTPGTANDTVDGMSLKRIRKIIAELRYERFRFRPARRIRIPKKSGGTRPLGLPNFTEKLVQEVLRMLLETYYEPRFRECSHDFRTGRGCHTALTQVHQQFQGASWLIEGDIKGCFDHAS